MAKERTLTISFKARWELYLLKIKVGDPFKSKLRIAVESIPELFRRKGCKVLVD